VAAIDIRKLKPSTAILLSLALRDARLLDLEEQILRKAQGQFPGDYFLNHQLGILLSRKNRFESLQFSRSAVALRPTNYAALVNLGYDLQELKRPDEALRAQTGRGLDAIWRAPGGRATPAALDAARSCGYAHVRWAPAGFLGDELPSES